LEVVDYRIPREQGQLVDLIAHNGSTVHFICGEQKSRVDEVDLRMNGVVIRKNNNVVATGTGSALLGHPAEAIALLANVASQHNTSLEKGEILLSGSLNAGIEIETN